MMKFVYTDKSGAPSYGFGLSANNLRRLKEGMPISIDLTKMGGQGRILIFYGETEQDMARDLAEFIGPDTKFSTDPRLAD